MNISSIWRTFGLVACIAGLRAVAAEPSEPVAQPPAAVPAPAPINLSPGLRDITKMLDAKVDASIIQAYIKNSPTLYNPTANEIIALKQRGVPDEIITSLLQRGAEVRSQLAANANAAPATAPMAPPAATQPAYGADYGVAVPYSYPVYPSYAYDYPYLGYGAVYPYYSSWWWNTWYPWTCSPFYGGYYGHHFVGHYPYNGYRWAGHYGGHSFAVGGFGNRSGAWSPVRGGFGAHTGGFAARGGFSGGGFGGHASFGGARGGGMGGASHGGHR